LNSGAALPAGGANYDFDSLIDVIGSDITTLNGSADTFSDSVVLGKDYSYFWLGFAANP